MEGHCINILRSSMQSAAKFAVLLIRLDSCLPDPLLSIVHERHYLRLELSPSSLQMGNRTSRTLLFETEE